MKVDFDLWPYPRMAAHRGAGKLAPENTLAAFRLGASFGYRMFEFDVKLAADGVPFLLHDSTLERTTSGAGVAGGLPWAALSALDAGSWLDAAYAGEPLPRLDAIARYLIANDLLADVEIKPTPGCDDETGRVVAAACERAWAGAGVPPLLTSFSEVALDAAAAQAATLPRGLLLDELP
ncbi:MAG: glycerophosphodiester phosphodiesterase family protein, partial [Lautropia sp.]